LQAVTVEIQQVHQHEAQVNLDHMFDIELLEINKIKQSIMEEIEFLNVNFDSEHFFSGIETESAHPPDQLNFYGEMESFYFDNYLYTLDDSNHELLRHNFHVNNQQPFNQFANKIAIF
jgi:hypothetical protein